MSPAPAANHTASGITYVPAVTIIANTFTTRRPIAIGLAATGSAVGGVIFPIMFRQLEPSVGFGWANRIIGLLFLFTSATAFFLLKPDPNHSIRKDSFFDMSALKEPSYILLCIGLFLIELGYWVPPFMIAPYAQSTFDTSSDFGFYLVAILNAGGFAGRIVPAYAAAQIKGIGAAWILFAGSLCLGIIVFTWIGVHNIGGLIAWGLLVGFMQGIPISFPNAIMPQLSPVASVVGARTGMMWMFVSFASLIGAPLAGLFIDPVNNDYLRGQIFSAVSICVGAVLLVIPALHVTRKKDS